MDLTCKQYARMKASERGDSIAFRQVMRRGAMQKCPKCGMAVARVSGCKFMTCTCGQHFCYHCGRGLSEDLECSHFFDDPFGKKCVGGAEDEEGNRAMHAPCDGCKGWSFGRTECTKCKYWQTGGKPPEGEDEDEDLPPVIPPDEDEEGEEDEDEDDDWADDDDEGDGEEGYGEEDDSTHPSTGESEDDSDDSDPQEPGPKRRRVGR